MTEDADLPPTTDRLFLGIPLAEGAREAIRARLGDEVLPGRRVPPDNWHLTLRFLGDTTPEAGARLMAELRRAPLGRRVEITFDGLGAFPREARASVLWVGVSRGARELGTIARETEARVRDAGFPAEGRPFAAHLTLARLQPPRDLGELVARVPPCETRMTVDAVVLFRSHLGRGPARYEEVERFALLP
jgi:2'-5' RNA ligase